MRLGCFHGLGFVYIPVIAYNPSLIAEVCGFGNADDQRICIEGTLEKLSDFDELTAFKVCEHLEGENRAVCMAAAERKMYDLEKDFSLYRDEG